MEPSSTTFADIHPHIIQSHILPRVDAPSLSIAATASPYLQTLCADQNLWCHTCNSTWPSTTHPRLHDVISTFPTGHLSFFQDSSPHVNRRTLQPSSTHPWPSQIISAVDIRYKNDVIYSGVEFTDTKGDFMSSELGIVLKDDPATNRSIDLKVDELVDADDPIIAHLKESVTLTWILIDPMEKRAVDLSSMKAVLGWVTEDIHLRYAIFLGGSGCETVECRIELTLGVGVGLHVRKVKLQLHRRGKEQEVRGREFLVIMRRAFMDRDGRESVKMGRVKRNENKKGWAGQDIIMQLASFLLCVYFTILLLI